MVAQEHWDAIYGRKTPQEVSWYRPHLERSLEFIDAAQLVRDAAIIDVGGGTSTLVDDLLERSYADVTVLDISAAAIARAKERLGVRATRVTWIVGDITSVELPKNRYDFWHDRAVFHFLVDPAARRVKKVPARDRVTSRLRLPRPVAHCRPSARLTRPAQCRSAPCCRKPKCATRFRMFAVTVQIPHRAPASPLLAGAGPGNVIGTSVLRRVLGGATQRREVRAMRHVSALSSRRGGYRCVAPP